MSAHMVLFFNSGMKTTGYDTVTAVVDQVLGFRNAAHVPSEAMSLVALAATGADSTLGTSELTSARVQSPKTVISPVYVRPINQDPNFFGDPNVACFAANPVLMRPGEEISASATVSTTGSPTTKTAVIVAWLVDRIEPIPSAESYWVPFTVSLPPGAVASWQTAAITFQDTTTLPAGRYAILGMQLVRPDTGSGVYCGRLVIPGEKLRPGIITSPEVNSLAPPLSYDNSLGVWGHFDAQLPPALEVFSPTAASGELKGFLRVAQVSH